MKLNEINDGYHQLTDKAKIESWLTTRMIFNTTIKSDNSIIVTEDVDLSSKSKDRLKISKLPVKFFHALKSFNVSHNELETLAGCPDIVEENFNASFNYDLKSFALGPKRVYGNYSAEGCNIRSLVGISDHIECISGELIITFGKIKEGGLGLLLIEELKDFYYGTGNFPTPWSIINDYLGRPDDIFECQNELIEAGFEEYAQL